jgi:hypothetical protein
VRPRGFPVHLRLPNVSILHASHQTLQQLVGIHRRLLNQVFDEHSSSDILADIQVPALSGLIKQVDDLLVVEFVVGAGDDAFGVGHAVDAGEQLSKGTLHHAAVVAHHGECFARAGLSVHKEAAVVALEGVGEETFADGHEEVLLVSGRSKDAVEGEGVAVELDFVVGVDHCFVFATRTDAHHHLDAVIAGLLVH